MQDLTTWSHLAEAAGSSSLGGSPGLMSAAADLARLADTADASDDSRRVISEIGAVFKKHPALSDVPRGGALRLSLRTHGPDLQLGPFFKLKEIACNDGSDEVLVSLPLMVAAHFLRVSEGPLKVNSGYRTESHDRKFQPVGSKSRSFHIEGYALDLDPVTSTPSKVGARARSFGMGGVGIYNTFTHVDVGDKGDLWYRS